MGMFGFKGRFTVESVFTVEGKFIFEIGFIVKFTVGDEFGRWWCCVLSL